MFVLLVKPLLFFLTGRIQLIAYFGNFMSEQVWEKTDEARDALLLPHVQEPHGADH